jgi:hypothetical protein
MSSKTETRIEACCRVRLLFLGGFNLVDLADQFIVSGQQFAEFDESADDENVHLHGRRCASRLC